MTKELDLVKQLRVYQIINCLEFGLRCENTHAQTRTNIILFAHKYTSGGLV